MRKSDREKCMKKFRSISEVWDKIDQGFIVYWCNESYQLTIEDSKLEWRQVNCFDVPFSNRNGKCLRVTCVSNWFGSLLNESELSNLFIKEKKA